MEKTYNHYFKYIYELQKIYLEGVNILRYLKDKTGKELNTSEFIELSYDLQAGSYTKRAKQHPNIYKTIAKNITNIINNLPDNNINFSILEVGIGEASTLAPLMLLLEKRISQALGFDISWSRIKYALKYLTEFGVNKKCQLFVADLYNIPLIEDAIDIVYTCHSLEPNGGREEDALKELYRVTKKYLILIEPDYENAGPEGQKRMNFHGYVKNLDGHIHKLGYTVLLSRPITASANKLNPSKIIVIAKKYNKFKAPNNVLICPITKKLLNNNINYMSTEGGLISYPVIEKIPCLLSTNGILTTHLLD